MGNLLGWRTNRKIIVFESDDWGSIRMPSKKVYHNLIRSGINFQNNHYNRYDSLESNKDLECLFEVISSYRDKIGNHPAFTGICVVANPDFEKISKTGFKDYYFEPFSETTKQYPAHNRILQLWKKGVERQLFIPQFHGREHLNVRRWLRDLQTGNKDAIIAFENRLWGIKTKLIKKSYQAAFDLDFSDDLNYLQNIINDGLDLFKELLGYPAKYFVPTNGPFNLSLEETLYNKGIRYITLDKRQKEPLGNDKYKTHYRYLGKKNRYGQIYLSRNASFEPSAEGVDWIDKCLNDIKIAFRMKKPATISTHRVNYIGVLDQRNRDRGLKQLSELLTIILRKWSEVEFMTSIELGDLISNKTNNLLMKINEAR
ncbi:MAG TPA: hypothetical protein ENO27_01395 [Caldithrix sp.]|nr:hypothetical protein [Caldithrix sp.]